jgi:hypothetical protein
MSRSIIFISCLTLCACASASYTHSYKAAELISQPIVTATGGFLTRSGIYGGIGSSNGPLEVYLYSSRSETNPNATQLDRCSPPSLAAYGSDPATWQKGRRYCPELFLVALPIGTMIQVDSVEWSWDWENGDRYSIQGHFVDPKYGKDEFRISSQYFLVPEDSPDQRLHLNPNYFVMQNP